MSRKLTPAILFAFLFSCISLNAQIAINEVLASNNNGLTDEDGSHQDWVELYNYGVSAVNLNGYGLSDDGADLLKWTFPNVTIAAGQYMLIWCSDKDRRVAGQPLHTNWKISSSGEAIFISDASGTLLQSSPAMALPADVSWGRLPNGSGSFALLDTPTPGAANTASSTGTQLSPPVFSQPSGFYTAGFSLTLSTTEPGATIIYTLDGSEPDESNLSGTTYNYKNQYPKNPGDPFGPMLFKSFTSLSYSAPIAINDRTSQPNKISQISSTFDQNPAYEPSQNIFKSTVVRAKVVKAGSGPSETITHTYFVTPAGSSRFTLPVVSMSFSENTLFDYDDGIYVAGQTFDQFRTDFPTEPASYPIGNYVRKGSQYEREVNFSYFVGGQEVLNQNVGIRIQGNYSRIYPSKSLNVYSKIDYGTDGMHYPFFSDEPYTDFARVVLKNSASDFYNSFFKDAFCAEMAKPLHTQTEADQPVVMMLNGEYWGLLTMREKYDDKFFNRVYGIPADEVSLLENDGTDDYIEEGTNTDYLDMIAYIENNSLATDANYTYIQTRMDVESFTDYFITNIFLQNEDWPGNNVVFWRRETAYNPNAAYGNDGRWRWAIHDMSSTMRDDAYDINTLAIATEPDGPEFPNPSWSTLILRKLLENNTYKNYFINRFADVLNSAFLPSRALPMIAQMKAQLQPEMAEQIARWKAPIDMPEWNYFTGQLNEFVTERPAVQRDHIRAEFGISGNINATLNVSDVAAGYVHINTIDIKDGTPGISGNPYPWTGTYFSNIPLTVKAIANPGYVFSHWTGANTSTDDEITVTSASNFSLTAVFIPEGFSNDPAQTITFWNMTGAIPNDTPLQALNATYQLGTNASIAYQSCLTGYPFDASNPAWRTASMERRNKPTPLNYRPEANGGTAYVAGNMKGIQITQPFQSGGQENTLIFNLPTTNFEQIKFSFAAMDEGAATGISIDYAVNPGAPIWVTTGLATPSFSLVTDSYQLYESDFSAIASASNNPDFRIRLRFTGPDMTANNGKRVTFNNIAVDGVALPLVYNTPNVFTVGQTIAPLVPQLTASADSFAISPALPDGLSFNATTGEISGTPTTASAETIYTVTATNVGGSASFGISITVLDPAPSSLSYNTPNTFTAGTAIAPLLPAVTGSNLTFSVSPALPDGLSLNAATGEISGTPTTVSASGLFTITATNSGGGVSFDIEITVNPAAPTNLSYTTPNVFTAGTAIAPLLPAVTGSNLTFSVLPALPDGLSLNAATGEISGTPTTASAEVIYTVTATNAGGSASFGISITVLDAAPSSLSYNTPNTFTAGTAIAPLLPAVTGSNLTFSVSPALPDGLLLNAATGEISGTPTTVSASGLFTITATNSGGSASFDIEITVNPAAPTNLSYTTPNVFILGEDIGSLSPTVTGTNLTFSISPALPAGLSFDAATGIISGTPTVTAIETTYTVTATNASGSVSFDLTIEVVDLAPHDLSYNTPNTFTIGETVNLLPNVSGIVSSYTISPALPAGLSFDGATGEISGVPTMVSVMSAYTVTASNIWGETTFDVEIEVVDVAPTSLSYTTPNVFILGEDIGSLSPTVTGTNLTFSISPALPAGLSFDTATGIISGTPSVASSETVYTVTAINASGSVSFELTIEVVDLAPHDLSYNTPNTFTIGETVNLLPNVSGIVSSYTISPALPAGLSFDGATGEISGVPTTISAMAAYTVTASNIWGETTFDVEIEVVDVAPAGLSYNTPNVFILGEDIGSLSPTVSGTNLTFSISPALSAGLWFDTATGIISGTPTVTAIETTYTVTATNTSGSVGFDLTIEVVDLAPHDLSYATPNTFTIGETVNLLPNVSGIVSSYTISPALPAGLSFDGATGEISGVPTTISAMAAYTVTASNIWGETTFDVEIEVVDVAPAGLSYNTPNVFILGEDIGSLSPTVSGTNLTFSISPALSAGLWFDTATGIISGTPTVTAIETTYTVTATNASGSVGFDLTIEVVDLAPHDLSYATPNTFTIGETVNLLPNVSGIVSSYTISPALPAGLSFDGATGEISGVPTMVSAMAAYTVTAFNIWGETTFDVEIEVVDVAPTSLSYTTPNVFILGEDIGSLSPTVSGTNLTFSISPALSAGLWFDTATGIISGTPTVTAIETTYTVTATNASGSVGFDLTIEVVDLAPHDLSYATPNTFTIGETVNLLPNVSGIVSSYTISPALPAGLSFDGATGEISGVPTMVSAMAAYTVTAFNIWGETTFDVEIEVVDVAPTSLSYTTPNVFILGEDIGSLSPTVTGTNLTFSISPALPAGLWFDAATGIISGTPTVTAIETTYTVTATNASGSVGFDLTIEVVDLAPHDLSYNTPNTFTIGETVSLLPNVSGIVSSYTISPALPAGLSFDGATGEISGVPTMVSAMAAYTVTAFNIWGETTFDVEIEVVDVAPAGLSYNTPNLYTVGIPIADLVPTVTGSGLAFSVVPELPQGLSIDPATGIISGIPTAITPEAAYTVTASNTQGDMTFDVVIEVREPLGIGDHENVSVQVYPNPFTDHVRVSGIGAFNFVLYGIDGREIARGQSDGVIAMPGLPVGVYLIRIEKDGRSTIKKLVKKE